MTNPQNRRSFIKKALIGAVTLPIIGKLDFGSSNLAVAQTVPNKVLDSSDPMAQAMLYVSDHTKVDKAKCPKYQDGQMCKGCILLLEAGKKIEGQDGEYGRCGLFQTGLVNVNGWCNSFAPKIS